MKSCWQPFPSLQCLSKQYSDDQLKIGSEITGSCVSKIEKLGLQFSRKESPLLRARSGLVWQWPDEPPCHAHRESFSFFERIYSGFLADMP